MRKSVAVGWLAYAVLLCAAGARGQANVHERLETARIYVDAVNGSDSNPGTKSAPVKTISQGAVLAAANNQNGIGTTVIINPGTYREALVLSQSATSLPITFEAATNGTVIISGADVWTGWQPYSHNPNIFTNAWPYQWGLCPLDPPGAPLEEDIVLRREMIFVNGTPLTQVLSLGQLIYPGSFFVDEAGGTVYIWPLAGTDINTATVEVSTRPATLSAYQQRDVVFRGLTFQYGNACRSYPGVELYGASNNVLFDGDNFFWNNSGGLTLNTPVTNVTVQNSVAKHNGQAGFDDFETKNVLWSNNQASYNNWRGAQGSYYHWDVSGFKFFSEHEGTSSGLTATFNQTYGVHWDTDNQNITASGMMAAQNLLSGAAAEKDEGPIAITGSKFCDNNPAGSTELTPLGGGLTLRNSQAVTLGSSLAWNNGTAQVNVQGRPGGIPVTNWETGQNYNLVTQNLSNTQNTLEGVGAGQQTFSDSYLTGADWTAFQSTLTSNTNTWWNASNSEAFTVATGFGGTLNNFPTWQSTTGQDLSGSVFAAPATDPAAACAISPDSPDYWVTVDNPTENVDVSGTAVYHVSVTPVGAYNGTVQVSLDGISEVSGLAATMSENAITDAGTTTLTVTAATSTAAGSYPLTVLANDGTFTHTMAFSVLVPQTSVRLSTANLVFPDQQINTTSAAQSVTLMNFGTSVLNVSGVTVSGGFAETNHCAPSVAPGGSCTINVTFTPSSVGPLGGTMSIASTDPASPQEINLSGTGTPDPLVRLSTYYLQIGSQEVGTTSAPQPVTVTNTGAGTLYVSSITIGGTNASEFAETDNCVSSGAIAPGGTCTVNVTFSPTAINGQTARLTLADNGPGGSNSATLAGNGTEPQAGLAPGSYNFGNQLVESSATKTFSLTDTGTANLDVSSIAMGGANAADFVITSNNCPATLAPQAHCAINVTFTPPVAGALAASLVVTDSAPNSPQSVSLSGTGTQPKVTLSPASLTFGDQNVGTKSAGRRMTLKNIGTGPLTGLVFSFSGKNLRNFSETNTCGSSVAARRSCVITVTFDPSAAGSRSGTLNIKDNAPRSPQSAALSGTGTEPKVTLSPASLTFGDQNVGTKSAGRRMTLKNSGTGPLTGLVFSFGGANPRDFSETNTCGSSLAAGKSCLFTVTFDPRNTGSQSGTLNIADNAPGSPQSAALSGTGIQPHEDRATCHDAGRQLGFECPPQADAARTLQAPSSAPTAQ